VLRRSRRKEWEEGQKRGESREVDGAGRKKIGMERKSKEAKTSLLLQARPI